MICQIARQRASNMTNLTTTLARVGSEMCGMGLIRRIDDGLVSPEEVVILVSDERPENVSIKARQRAALRPGVAAVDANHHIREEGA